MTYLERRENPHNTEDLRADIETHPDRGRLEDKPIVKFEPKEISGFIPENLYDEFLQSGAAMGLDKDALLLAAITKFVTDPGVIALRQAFINRKALKHNTTTLEIHSKIIGAYKGRTRLKRLKQLETEKNQPRL
jgi:hypothetical protein